VAFLAEQAGGKASNGKQRILKVSPHELHQRTPFYCGNSEIVDKVKSLLDWLTNQNTFKLRPFVQ
jgi:fructose-1,6-bisphosphatase I